jgi:hypothetical protein
MGVVGGRACVGARLADEDRTHGTCLRPGMVTAQPRSKPNRGNHADFPPGHAKLPVMEARCRRGGPARRGLEPRVHSIGPRIARPPAGRTRRRDAAARRRVGPLPWSRFERRQAGGSSTAGSGACSARSGRGAAVVLPNDGPRARRSALGAAGRSSAPVAAES